MTRTRDIILRLKEVRRDKGLSYNDILDMMEQNGDYLAKSTLSRVFSKGSEDLSFRYEETIRPIAKALLGSEDELRAEGHKKSLKRLRKEKKRMNMEYLINQIELKDRRIDMLLDVVLKDRI